MGALFVAAAAAAVVIVVLAGAGASNADSSSTSSHRALAGREASALLSRLRLPAGAAAVHPAPGTAGIGGVATLPATPALIDRAADWSVPGSSRAVQAYLRAHAPAGTSAAGGGSGSAGAAPSSTELTFTVPHPPAGIASERLVVQLEATATGPTVVRADAQVIWIVSRAASERVPAGVHEIDVTRAVPGRRPTLVRHVSSAADVAAIVAMIDGLGVVQPGTVVCPSQVPNLAQVQFVFRAHAGGQALASAAEVADATEPTTACDPLTFAVDGRARTPLLHGARFLRAVSRRLGVRLWLAPYAA